MCQNGPPTGKITPNADGDDVGFATQVLSRFLVSYLLAHRRALSPDAVVLTICNSGQSYDVPVDDLNLHADLAASWTRLGFFFAQSARDSTVLDAFMVEQNRRFPEYRFFHLYPEMVATPLGRYDLFPFPLDWLFWLALKTPLPRSPESIADVAVYVS